METITVRRLRSGGYYTFGPFDSDAAKIAFLTKVDAEPDAEVTSIDYINEPADFGTGLEIS